MIEPPASAGSPTDGSPLLPKKGYKSDIKDGRKKASCWANENTINEIIRTVMGIKESER